MSKEILIFGYNGINKNKFHKRKQPININKIDIKRLAISDEDLHGSKGSFRYFIECKSKEGTRPLCIKHPQLSGYAKYFNGNNKSINFVVHNKKLLKTYNAILNRVSSLIKKGFRSEPVYNNKYNI